MWWKKKSDGIAAFSVHPEFFLGVGTVSAGSLTLESDILIDGSYTGDITSSGLLEIGTNAKVAADVSARVAIIQGQYEGKAEIIDEVQIKNCSNISGSVKSANIIIEKGAILNTKCKTT